MEISDKLAKWRRSVPVLSVGIFVALMGLVLALSWWQTRPPRDFPTNVLVEIPRGLSASSITDHLKEKGVIRNSHLFYLILLWRNDPSEIKAGAYNFSEPQSAFKVAELITADAPPDTLVRLTFPEGFSVADYAKVIKHSIPDFDTEKFLELASPYEGYLFPDTYNVPGDYSPSEFSKFLQDTYRLKTAKIDDRMQDHFLGEYGVLTLASLLEREANSEESMRIVAGILLSRLEIPMRLQVDASVEYVVGHKLNGTRAEDLKIDSPYNTYLYDGLPPTPIGNPGLTAIKAVLDPIKTDYLYYLTDADGNFYYAETFEEHKMNIERYLR